MTRGQMTGWGAARSRGPCVQLCPFEITTAIREESSEKSAIAKARRAEHNDPLQRNASLAGACRLLPHGGPCSPNASIPGTSDLLLTRGERAERRLAGVGCGHGSQERRVQLWSLCGKTATERAQLENATPRQVETVKGPIVPRCLDGAIGSSCETYARRAPCKSKVSSLHTPLRARLRIASRSSAMRRLMQQPIERGDHGVAEGSATKDLAATNVEKTARTRLEQQLRRLSEVAVVGRRVDLCTGE